MAQQDTSQLKDKIVNTLRIRGPSLPVHIAKEINSSTLFTSAFLSELISERKIKISNMKVGSSKIHFLLGQESKLENFSQYLKSKEKDAFILLKERKFLKDSKQQPAIRVALRSIKDFAIAFKNGEEIIWRYYLVPELNYQKEEPIKIKEEPKTKPTEEKEIEKKINIEKVNIFDKEDIKEEPIKIKEEPKTKPTEEKPVKKPVKKKSSQKKNEKFFNQVKEFLSTKSIEIIGIEGFSKNDLTLTIKKEEKEFLLIAYNKKRFTDIDLINANKKAIEKGLHYMILSLGDPLKKTNNLIEAVKNLYSIEKIK